MMGGSAARLTIAIAALSLSFVFADPLRREA